MKQIKKFKTEKGALIVAHNYQIPEVQDLADFTGDSLELARKIAASPEKLVVFCGVRFMAETAKILAPDKKVLIPRIDAGCPMADMVTAQDILNYRKKYPDATIVGYVNTNAETKVELDVCVTSANAVDIVKKLPAKRIVFVPDRNLGYWVKKNVTDKEIILHEGFCIVHESFKRADIETIRSRYPQAKIVVHPECPPEVVDIADEVASTSGMLRYIEAHKEIKHFVIGTEEGHIYKMKKLRPDAEFYSLGDARICSNMKKTRLEDVLKSIDKEQYEILLSENIIKRAKAPIEKMVKI